MPHAHVQPETSSFNAAIMAMRKGTLWAMALQLFQEMRPVRPDRITANALIRAGAEGEPRDAWKVALQIFQWMRELDLCDTISYNTVLASYAASRRWAEALAFFASMRGDTASPPRVVHPTRGAPDAVSYGAVASAAEKAAVWPVALQILEELVKQPELEVAEARVTFNIAISAAGKAAEWSKALQLLNESGLRRTGFATSKADDQTFFFA
eukprot:g22820.t1